ncbi:MAG TPA: hypothetical protein VK531_02865, partial [Gemmatimonadales bacterium]|nr:hypothetical protein [Gemmatimonadales bacterium]
GLVPVADFLVNGAGVASDVINMKQYEFVRFILFWGVGATGTNTLTIEACDDVVPTNKTAVPFWYRVTTAFGAVGAIAFQPVPATGLLTLAGSNQIIELYTTAEYLAATGFGYVRLKSVPGVASALLGGCLIELISNKYQDGAEASAIT